MDTNIFNLQTEVKDLVKELNVQIFNLCIPTNIVTFTQFLTKKIVKQLFRFLNPIETKDLLIINKENENEKKNIQVKTFQRCNLVWLHFLS